MTPDQKAEAVRMALAGKTTREIAAAFHLTYQRIAKILEAEGLVHVQLWKRKKR